jgi:hypothetical protein
MAYPGPTEVRPCIVCRGAIEAAEVEREIEGAGIFLYAHEAWYKIWREESVSRRAAGSRPKEP